MVDSDAYITMPLLMSSRDLNYLCPGVKVDQPPVDQPPTLVIIANESSMSMVGTTNLLFLLSGNNIRSHKVDQRRSCTGAVMDYWYPVSAAIFDNMNQLFIMSASLL